MKTVLVLVAALSSTAALAQSNPPTFGGRPLLQVKPQQAKPKTASGKPQALAVRLQKCLEIDDGTKGRLDCYDGVLPPQPRPKAAAKPADAKPAAAKAVMDCRFTREEDERLACFNDFVERIPKLPAS